MLLAILCPEFIFGWAVREWFAARKIRDIYNSINPGMLGILISDIQTLPRHDVELPRTMDHAYFFIMGGLLPYQTPFQPTPHALSLERFQQLIQTSNLQFPPYITKEYLKDRF